MSEIFDSTVGALNTSLNLRELNQNVIGSNIANADTPGYKAKTVEFEGKLREILKTGDQLTLEGTNPDHIVPRETEPVFPEVYDDPNGVESLDGNTVDRAHEMAKLSENQILYNTSAELLKKKLGFLRYAVTEGGGNR